MFALTNHLAVRSRVSAETIRQLEQICPGRVRRDVSLAQISRWRIGGIADVIVHPRNTDELCRLRTWLHDVGLPHIVLGATSNLLFADEGLQVVCIQIGAAFGLLEVLGTEIRAGAGVWVPGLARRAMQSGLGGIEHVSGIPGTLGGLICMNGGSLRRGIGEVLTKVVSVDDRGMVHRRSQAECGFAYRRSVFQSNGEVIVEAGLKLESDMDRRAIRRRMLKILADRRSKFPQKTPNCGSVFVSNPAMYAQVGPPGAVIERLGFKGRRVGDAMVSPWHANFIVNVGCARANDVLALIAEIRSEVMTNTGYTMEVEARFVRADGTILPAGDVASPDINTRCTGP